MKPYFLQDLTALGVRLSIPLSSRYCLHRTSHPIALFRLNTKDYNNSPHVLSISVPGTAKPGFQNDCHSCRYQEAACQTRKTWSNCQSLPPWHKPRLLPLYYLTSKFTPSMNASDWYIPNPNCKSICQEGWKMRLQLCGLCSKAP